MREHILHVINSLYQHRELIAEAYALPQGISAQSETEAAFSRLLKVKALTPYIEGDYRLDRRLRMFLDRAVNRVKIYGNSTHYAQVVGKLVAMTDDWQHAVIAANAIRQDECIDEIIDLCDEFATGMKEDIEHFRMVIESRSGFTGGSLGERLTHNKNYVTQAGEMVTAVGLLDAADLLGSSEGFSELVQLFRRHLFARVEGSEDLRRRLFEVQGALQAALFDLQAADRISQTLLRMDERLSHSLATDPDVWNDEHALADMFYRFDGFALPAYLDPDADYGEHGDGLLPLLAAINDERRPQSRIVALRAGQLDDSGPPAPSRPTPSEFRQALALLQEHLVHCDKAQSLIAWLRHDPRIAGVYSWSPAIWLATLSTAIDNGLPAPAGWAYSPVIDCVNLRWETPVLTDIHIQPVQPC